MKRFASPGQAQRFLFAFGHIGGHFRPRRHLMSAPQRQTEMTARFAVWDEIIAAAAAHKQTDVMLEQMNYLVEGVIGKV